MSEWWYWGIGVAVVIAGYVIYRVTYARAYERGYRDSNEDFIPDSSGIRGVSGVCGKCGWEAPQGGTMAQILQSIISHDCDEE